MDISKNLLKLWTQNKGATMNKYLTNTLAICFFTISAYTSTSYATDFSDSEHQDYFKNHCPNPRQGGNSEYYSQFYEDYILSIVFSNSTKGYYIDVGANSPSFDSVTKHFYDKGWSGINIEPIEKLHALYRTERPRDISINTGISNEDGEIDFYILSSDLMSTGKKDFALSAENKGYTNQANTMKVTTLNKVITENPLDEITFLKIDVEGMEKEVLEGIDLKNFRPKLFVIESIVPFSHKRTDDQWKHILLNNNYRFMYFDSLNTYYVSEESFTELKDNFARAIKCNQLANEKYPEYKIENIFKHELDRLDI